MSAARSIAAALLAALLVSPGLAAEAGAQQRRESGERRGGADAWEEQRQRGRERWHDATPEQRRRAMEKQRERLRDATPEERANWQISAGGFGIHWPDLDEDLSTEGLLRGAPASRPLSPSSQ